MGPFLSWRFGLALMALFVAGPLQAQAPLDVVPIRYQPPTLVVQASVNGSRARPFAFDTGSTVTLIDTALAQRLKLSPRKTTPGTIQPAFARVKSLAVGKAKAQDLEAVVRDLSPLAQYLGVDLAGIVGFNWMQRFVFEIDPQANTLTLWPSSVELNPQADQLPIPLELAGQPNLPGASLFIPATLDGHHTCKMEIDTGAGVGILGREIAEKLGAELQPARTHIVLTLSGPVQLATHSVTRVDLAGRTFGNVLFFINPERGRDGNPYEQCVLGNDQLRAFALTLDIPRQRALFRALFPGPVPVR
jgi:predicted aspartyl protease